MMSYLFWLCGFLGGYFLFAAQFDGARIVGYIVVLGGYTALRTYQMLKEARHGQGDQSSWLYDQGY
jgi:hypothetical protein